MDGGDDSSVTTVNSCSSRAKDFRAFASSFEVDDEALLDTGTAEVGNRVGSLLEWMEKLSTTVEIVLAVSSDSEPLRMVSFSSVGR